MKPVRIPTLDKDRFFEVKVVDGYVHIIPPPIGYRVEAHDARNFGYALISAYEEIRQQQQQQQQKVIE